MKNYLFLYVIIFLSNIIFSNIITNQTIASKTSSAKEVKTLREDPLFLRLQFGNLKREIYILGVDHGIKPEELLTEAGLKELQRIANLNAVLFLEHTATNETSLKLLESAKITMKESWIIPGNSNSLSIELTTFLSPKLKEKIYENMLISSNKTLFNLATVDLWLAVPIIGMHVGVIYKKKFSGFENELENAPKWTSKWTNIRYLETQKSVLEILKSTKNNKRNLEALEAIIKKWMLLEALESKNSAEKALAQQFLTRNHKIQIEGTTWKLLNESRVILGKDSIFIRNTQWIKVLKDFLLNDKNPKFPVLIVVGTAHLMKPNGLLELLLKLKEDFSNPERFSSNSNAWVGLKQSK